tara:strand:- start:918 stop:1091 length:174 start_codon:yes stop_codon:yes gene_type:complete
MKTFEIRVLKTSTHVYRVESESLEKAKSIENFDPIFVGDEIGGKDLDETVLSVREIT